MQKYFFCRNGQIWLLKIKKSRKLLCIIKNKCIFASHLRDAQMAESVDALVSNTSGFTSIPVRPRVWVLNKKNQQLADSFFCIYPFYEKVLVASFLSNLKKSCRARFVFYTIFAETNFKKWKHTYIRYCLRQHRLTWRRLYWAF